MSKLEQVGGTLLRRNGSIEVLFKSEISTDGSREESLEYTINGVLFGEIARESLIDLAVLKTVVDAPESELSDD